MEEITISVNNKEIPLTDFPKSIIIKTILGMLQALKGVEDVKTVEIKIKRG
jgi:hypothetical protein